MQRTSEECGSPNLHKEGQSNETTWDSDGCIMRGNLLEGNYCETMCFCVPTDWVDLYCTITGRETWGRNHRSHLWGLGTARADREVDECTATVLIEANYIRKPRRIIVQSVNNLDNTTNPCKSPSLTPKHRPVNLLNLTWCTELNVSRIKSTYLP